MDIQIDSLNTPPVANAGADQSVYMGELVTLDGSASSDVDGDLLTWFWSISNKPAGSTAELDDDGLVQPTFTPDLEGQYVIQLIVDDDEDSSQSDSVIINVLKPNTLPIADAGPDQSGYVGDIIQLDASGSSDADNDTLSFDWSLMTTPSGSSAVLDYPDSINPSFLLDIPGNYVAQLIVNDGLADSAPDEVVITTINSRPVADPGNDYAMLLGETIQLDGSSSSDADGQDLNFSWSIISRPDGSAAALSDTQSATPSFEPDLIGFYVFQLMVSDGDLDSEPVTVTLQVNAVEPLAITLNEPSTNIYTNEPALNLRGALNRDASLTINNESVVLESDFTFVYPAVLIEGINFFTLKAVDITNNQTTMSRYVVLDTIVPEDPVVDLITIDGPDENGLVIINGQNQSVESVSEVVLKNLDTDEEATVSANEEGAFRLQINVNPEHDYGIFVQDIAGNQSQIINVIEGQSGSGNNGTIPPDPATIAPILDPTQSFSLHNAIAFLFSGSNPIQTGVNPSDIEPKQVAVIRGKVLNRDNSPLSGVSISIHNHPEYGQTLSREDGQFDLVVNGGGLLTVNYQKEGFLPVQRKLDVPWRDFIHADDVVMIPLDPNVTSIDLNNNLSAQIAKGSVQTDIDGTRQAAMLFMPGTTATMILPDDTSQSLTNINVRATEYTVGDNGPNAMPGPLPSTSGYTYAVELSVDEALAAGATTVEFNQPVNVYVDNFLDFPVGEIVPIGYYDKVKAAWIASKNGKIIKIISHTDGKADISLDDTGTLASQTELDTIGITDEERIQLAENYASGTELWRVQITHMTPWDCNWPYGPPMDAEGHKADEPKTEYKNQPDDPCEQSGCIIEAENQVLGETINITGTSYSLNYRSSNIPGYKVGRTLTIPLSAESVPNSLLAIDLTIRIAGQVFRQRYPASPNQTITWDWDGQDIYGRYISGSQRAFIKIDYLYPTVYYPANRDFVASFARLTDPELRVLSQRGSRIVKLSKSWQKYLTNHIVKQTGLGYWGLNVHHQYDQASKILSYGNGLKSKSNIIANSVIYTVAGIDSQGYGGEGGQADETPLTFPHGIAIGSKGEIYIAEIGSGRVRQVNVDGTIQTIAGNGGYGFSGDGGLAVNAEFKLAENIAVGPNGELYIADNGNNRIRKVDADGIITTVAGNGSRNYSGDGGPAIEAGMDANNIAVGPEGELYIVDTYNHRIRKVGTDGIITTIAGDGFYDFSGDGGSALEAGINSPSSIAVGANGELYIADYGNYRIRKVDPSGIITTVAGNGQRGFSGDGGPALEAMIHPYAIAIGSEGELYIADDVNRRVRKVDSFGIITTVAGNGQTTFSGDSGLAVNSAINSPKGVAVGPEGDLYISSNLGHRVWQVASPWPGFSIGDYTVNSKAGDQIFYFDASGHHLNTKDAITGVNLYSFNYTEAGLLDSIVDINGLVTQIERNDNGIPLTLLSPFGQITSLNLDANGFLSGVTNPLGDQYLMSYDSAGLMMTFRDLNNTETSYQYDSLGRLIGDIGPENSGWSLSRNELENGYNVTMMSAEGRDTVFQVNSHNSGNYERKITSPDSLITTQTSKSNGEKVIEHPDGSVVTTISGPNPRFGMLAPIPINTSIQSPNGLLFSSSKDQSVTLTDNNDSLSLLSLVEVSSINGKNYTSQYDGVTKTWLNTSPVGRSNSILLNEKGQPIYSQISGFDSTDYSYDNFGRLSLIRRGSGSSVRNISLNYYQNGVMNGYLRSITNAENQITQFEYDAVGRVTKQILPDDREILYSYDANGNIISLTPPGRTAHIFNYDGLDQSTQYTPPAVDGMSNPQTTYSYSRDKQLIQITRPDGQEVNLSYGATSGKLDTIVIPSGSISYVYDSGTGQLSSITAPDNGILNFNYDGFLRTQTQWSGDISGIVAQNYNNDFRVTDRSVNGANNVNFQYDNDNLLTQAGSLMISRETQKGGLINGTSLDNLTTSKAYNGFAELTSFSVAFNGTNLYSTSYSRDKLGRIIQKVESIEGESTTTNYEYDLAGRLISETKDNITLTYTYDSNGNRTHINGTSIGSYDEQDRLISYAQSDYQYSANGELQTKIETGQTSLYDYDVLGNLKQVILNDGTVVDYVIDGRDRRIGKMVNGTLVQGYLYKDQLNPIAELDGNNQIISRFVYGSKSNVPDYMIKNGITYRIVSDHLGSPRLIVDSVTGDIIQRMDYDTWGNIVSDTNPGFQPFGFGGGLYDQHTQLTRLGARDYDSYTARWTLKDPIQFEGGGTNFYNYVLNDPVNNFDPNGLEPFYVTPVNSPGKHIPGVPDSQIVGIAEDVAGGPNVEVYRLNGSFILYYPHTGGTLMASRCTNGAGLCSQALVDLGNSDIDIFDYDIPIEIGCSK